jgi:hypothetical protein
LPLAVIVIPIRVELVLFVIVTVFAVVVELTASLPKAKLTGVNVTGATPVPVKVTICGEFEAVSLTVITPEMLPVAEGLNVTLIVHVAPALRLLPQVVLDCAKSPDAGEIESEVEAVPVFFTVTTLAGVLVDPTACAVNVSAAGVTVIVTVVAFPVPVRLMDCGELDA